MPAARTHFQIEALMPRQLLSAGLPDNTFGSNGYVTMTDISTEFVLPAGQGKTVAIGYAGTGFSTGVERFTSTGALDTTFDNDGKVQINRELSYASLIQSDGKIVVAVHDSNAKGYLVRLNTNGSIDTAFGTAGYATSPFGVGSILSMAQQSDGKLVVVGNNQQLDTDHPTLSITRFNTNGTLDTAFGSAGKFVDLFKIGGYFSNTAGVTSGNTKVGILPDGKILVMANPQALIGGYGTIFYRLNTNGTQDTSFYFSGGQWFDPTSGDDELSDMTMLSDGSVVAVGYQNGNDYGIWKYRPITGSQLQPDTSFDGDGMLDTGTTRFSEVHTENDNKIIAASTQFDSTYTNTVLTVARYQPSGLIDTSFGTAGRWTKTSSAQESIHAAAVDPTQHSVTLYTFQNNDTTNVALYRLLRLTGDSTGVTTPLTAVPGSYTVAENGSITLNGSASNGGSGTITKYEWDYNYDGVSFTADATGAKPAFSAAGIDGPSTRVIALRVTDSNGATAVQKTTVTITNAAPVAVLTGGTVALGNNSLVTFTSISDVSADASAGYTFAYDFNNDGDFTDAGDIASTKSSSASFKYTAAGTYTVHARVTDKDGGYRDVTAKAVVNGTTTTNVTLQAEDAVLSGGTAKATNHTGYTGTGFADYGGSGSAVQFTVAEGPAGADTTLSFRYANGATTARPLSIVINGTTIGSIACNPTGSWDTWGTVTISTHLLGGNNTIKAVAGSVGGGNLDSLTITSSGTTPPPTTGSSVYIDAGGPASGSFSADAGFSGGKTLSYTNTVNTGGVTNPAPQAVYQTERYGDFIYTIANLVAGQQYTVQLDLVENYWTAAGKRSFNVTVNNAAWLSNFDVYSAAGGKNIAIARTIKVAADSSGKIAIGFKSLIDNAKVNGIRVTPAS